MSAAITPNLDTISLYFKQGTSDKEYHVDILGNEADGFRVQYKYGKRGAKLQVKWKTPLPIPYAAARKEFDKMVASQLRDGYTTGEAGTPYQSLEANGKVSGILPMLLNEIDESEAPKYISDDAWVMQEKKNGCRLMIKKVKKTVEGVNKKGLVISLPLSVETAIRQACGDADATLDGEIIGEVYWLFDLITIGVHSYADKTVLERQEAIQEWLVPDMVSDHMKLVPTAVGKSIKNVMFKKLKQENAEGVVFKKKDSTYKPGRSPEALKSKFYASATVRVRALNATKASFQMEMLKKGDWTFVGDCTYYPTIYVPKVGEFCEVRYMYATEGSILYGPPVLLGQRKDVDDGDCVMSQLKYKQGIDTPNDDDDN